MPGFYGLVMSRVPSEHIATDDLIAALVDPESWRSWDAPVASEPERDEQYTAALARAHERCGRDESVVTGSGRIADVPVAVVANDFDFLAGSIGQVAGQRIVAAVERATALGLPLIGLPNSGGTRVQEGTPAFLMMVAIAGAVRRHRDAGLPYLVYLRNPTTGGVFATWGSLGDVTHAQPDALVAFLGPRVYEGLYGEPFPDGVQTSEHLAECGVIDGVATPEQWRRLAARLLGAWQAAGGSPVAQPWHVSDPSSGAATGSGKGAAAGAEEQRGWDAVTATRGPDRRGLADLLELTDDTVHLSGTQRGEVAAATVLAVTRVAGIPCVVVGQDRAAQARGRRIGPADLRVVQRGIDLAGRWGLPLLTIVDTQGGELSASAESGAISGEIGRCLSDLAVVPTPTLCLLLGAASGGAALALIPADRVIAARDAWITPLPPEGAAIIVLRSAEHADDMADSLRITTPELTAVGAVDRVVPGPEDLEATMAVVAEELAHLAGRPVQPGARALRWKLAAR